MLLAVAGDDVQPLRLDPLEALEQGGVDAHLEDGAGLDRASELRVGDVVAPPTEGGARAIAALEQEVRVAAPPAVEEGRLEDDVGAVAHRFEGHGLRGAQLVGRAQVFLRDLDDTKPARTKRRKVRRLVQVALLLDQLDRRIVTPDRLLPAALDTPELECREMVAGQVSDEVRGTDDQGPVGCDLHVRTVAAGRASLPVRPPGRRAATRTRRGRDRRPPGTGRRG